MEFAPLSIDGQIPVAGRRPVRERVLEAFVRHRQADRTSRASFESDVPLRLPKRARLAPGAGVAAGRRNRAGEGLRVVLDGDSSPSSAPLVHLRQASALGGYGTVTGPIVGAVVYERLRGFLITNPTLSNAHMVIAGALLLLIVVFVTAGVIGWVRQRVPALRRYLE